MIEQLFGSKTRVKLLKLFYSNPNRPFYVREITRKIDEQINSVRRELSNLLSIGIISSENNNNKLYYEVDQTYEYYSPLSTIFGGGAAQREISKNVSIPEDELSGLTSLGNVDLAIYTGRFTRDESAGIDFLIVGDVNPTKVGKYVEELEGREGKEIRYAFMGTDEFIYRRRINDRFLAMVLDSKMQVLFDKNYLITEKPKANTVKEPKKDTKKNLEEE